MVTLMHAADEPSQTGNHNRQRLESLGILAGGIAHDFNNLLGMILADAEFALAELPRDSSCRSEIQNIRTVAMRASEIVRELMIYAGLDGGGVMEPVNLSGLVEEMLHLLKMSIPKSTVLRTDLSKRLPPVVVNAPRLRQVVMNLILNAAEAIGPQGGLIHVSTSRLNSRSRSSEKPQPADGEFVCLKVSDTGCGISEEVQARIFDPFFTTKLAGRGLGLAVVKSFLDECGGSVRVVSAPGQGTRFELLLPSSARPAAPKPSPVAAVAETTHAMSGSVLLVEDEEGLRITVAKILRKHGLSVIEVGDGWSALELIRNPGQGIDLILLDMTMPGPPSHEVFAESRRIRPETKVILTSAYSREAAGPSFDAPQLEGFIRKPYQVGELVELLRKTLTARPATNATAT
jgi:nitrogen-specific signal transduction histidine kinase